MQETLTTLLGMVVGMVFTRATAQSATAAWLLFTALTLLHVYANVRAMRCLVLHSLNQPRLDLLIHRWVPKGKCVFFYMTVFLPGLSVESALPRWPSVKTVSARTWCIGCMPAHV